MKRNLPVTGKELRFTGSIISRTDLKGSIVSGNEAFFAISGFAPDELVGKSHNMIRHPEMPPRVFAELWRTLESGQPWHGVIKNRCRSGDHYWVEAFVTPTFDADGVACGYKSVRKVPARSLVVEAERRYAAMLAEDSAKGEG